MHLSKVIQCVIIVVVLSDVSESKKRGKATKTPTKIPTTYKTTQSPIIENVTEIDPAFAMKGVILDHFGPPKNLTVKITHKPKPGPYQEEFKVLTGLDMLNTFTKLLLIGDGDCVVLVRLKAAGINIMDTEMRSGNFTFKFLPRLPAILGQEGAGVIEELGSGVFNLKVGQKVICCLTGTGTYAEYVVCNATHAIPFPDTLTFNEAAAVYVSYFTAYRALVQKAKVKRNETVYISGGTGGFGIAAIQIAKNLGCTVTATYGADRGRKLLKKVGADFSHSHRVHIHTVKHYQNNNEKGWDVIIDTIAHKHLAESHFCINMGTRIVVVGSAMGGTILLNPIITQNFENVIMGVLLRRMSLDDFREAAEYLTKGMLDGWVKPIIDRTYKIDDIVKAHKDIEEKAETLGKYVLEID